MNESKKIDKTFVSTLVLVNIVTSFPVVITSLLLIEISQSFGIEVGTANQVRAVGSMASIVMGLLMSGLSVRFKHKSLYLAGLGLLCISALVNSFSPIFIVMLVAFAIYGASRAMIRPMGHALVGRFFSLDQRPKITGYLIVGMASSFFIGSLMVNIISDWKLMFSIILLPLTLVTFFLALKGIPSTPKSQSTSHQFQQAYKDVLLKKSALACLIGGILWKMPANAVVVSLASSFYRQSFQLNRMFVSFAFVGVSLISIVGSFFGGRLVNRFGRKRLTVISSLSICIFTLLYVNIPNLWFSLIMWYLGGFFVGVVNTSYASLALEQAPDFRGTMMSLSEVAMYLGQGLGNALAGFLLLGYNYGIVSLIGGFSLIGAIIFQFFTLEIKKQ